MRMDIVYVGDFWQGSTARSLSEALAALPGVSIDGINEDAYLPIYRGLPMRLANRLLNGLQRRELSAAVMRTLDPKRHDVFVVYKGRGIGCKALEKVKRLGIPTINIFPDCSPHAHGSSLRETMGYYDLVISTKPLHPELWRSVYGYDNRCVCVPHGYDPDVHYWSEPAPMDGCDVALCATWRPEYHRLMVAFAQSLADDKISVSIGGFGWQARMRELPRHWQYVGAPHGRAYGHFLRSARMVIAPVNREVVIKGRRQPGDEDTTRTYELAAARCFFLHQRTDYVATVYDEQTEVPFWSNPNELAQLVRRWLADDAGRRAMADRAHARAVPAYSFPQRAQEVRRLMEEMLAERKAPR